MNFLLTMLFLIFGPVVGTEAQNSFQEITPGSRMTNARAMYLTQGFTDPDQKVGEAIQIGDRKVPAKTNEKGELLLDVSGDEHFGEHVRDESSLSVSVSLNGKERSKRMKLYFMKHENSTWTYRNAMEIQFRVGSDRLVVVDLNGNGKFNDAGVDGMTWSGQQYCFPLPSKGERFATPHAEVKSFTMGPWGDDITAQARRLRTVHANTLPILKGVNHERVKVGLTPRGEDPKLSKQLMKHCKYMALNGTLRHGEDKGKPGYSREGKKAGQRSILSRGRSPSNVAMGMMATYFHRQDVVRPGTSAFGVGFVKEFSGIDGRGNRDQATPSNRWPYRIPAPNQRNVPTHFNTETPDPLDGDEKAGYPITMYFQRGKARLKDHSLVALNGRNKGQQIPCYSFDPGDGGFYAHSNALCIIAKSPLSRGIVYEITLKYTRTGSSRTVKWRFATKGAPGRGWQLY